MRALIAGTFDPITVGHNDMIRRASLMFDEIVVVIFNNSEKQNFFTDKQRIEMVDIACAHIKNVSIDSHNGMLAEYMHRNGINIIIKGVRNVSDFTYEYMLAEINRSVYDNIETLFMPSKPEYQHVSSSVVREFLKHGADISKLVPPSVLEYIKGVKK
ncbi:MAG: pantetheine-phosphate adenylyltransferase [Oscillospiraceae bacterium]|nr:pantetheine-phosphate adenylyltransferase [Oscillospiraceae bacterium]